jgi:hypothetical protein
MTAVVISTLQDGAKGDKLGLWQFVFKVNMIRSEWKEKEN